MSVPRYKVRTQDDHRNHLRKAHSYLWPPDKVSVCMAFEVGLLPLLLACDLPQSLSEELGLSKLATTFTLLHDCFIATASRDILALLTFSMVSWFQYVRTGHVTSPHLDHAPNKVLYQLPYRNENCTHFPTKSCQHHAYVSRRVRNSTQGVI